MTCDCLTKYDASFPHFTMCAGAESVPDSRHLDSSDYRALAELAAWRDLDTALYCLRGYYRQQPQFTLGKLRPTK